MKIWELLPIDPTSEHWEASSHTGRVVVRAGSENRARDYAARRLGKGAGTSAVNGLVLHPPWGHSDLVECRELTDGTHDTEGREAILDPADLDPEWRG